ncbi:MAG: CHAT domain-containing protein [Candidatus Competibacter sp.]
MKRSTKAERWFDEGVQHYQAGDPQKAFAAFGQAEVLYRALIDDNQDHYRPDLALTRMNEGVALSDLNRPEEACARYEEAAAIYQALIAAGQPQYRPNLALTRMNEGNALRDLNRPEEACARYEEAAAIYQALIAAGQPQYRPNLAHTRMNEGNALRDLNRPEEACARYEEAAAIYQALIAAGQPQYRPDLALTRMNEGVALRDLNRPEEACARYEAAAAIYQALIAAGQPQYRPNLALTRMNEGNALRDLNRPEEACARYEAAAAIYQALIAAGQPQYRPNLVKMRVNAAIACADKAELEAVIAHLDRALAVWEGAETMPAVALNQTPHLAELIGRTRSVAGFAARVEQLTQQIARALGGVAPQNLGQFYPWAESAFTGLLNAALDENAWDLALTVIGTARAQRLAKLAQADLLRRAAREDDPAALREYREVIRRFAELEILLNTGAGASGEGTTSGRGGGGNAGQQYQTLYNEYTTLRGKLGKLEQTLRQQNLLPDLGAGLFDGAGLRQKLPPTAALLLLVQVQERPANLVVVLTRDGGRVLAMEGGSDWTRRLEGITRTLKGKGKDKGRTLRDGPGGDTRTASAGANARAVPPELADAQTEALTEALTEQFWQPIQNAVGDAVNTVWLLPTGDLHGLPWQASAPPEWRCRLAPAPWFVRQALDATAAAPICPTAAAPLGVLAYAAPDSDKELPHMALEERGVRAAWGDAAHALAGLDRAPAPPPAYIVIGGHGDSDETIPGAARILVGHDGAEPRHAGFGEIWNAPLSPFLLLLYFSSCVVGRTREVNGEPLGLISAGLLRGVRYLVGWSVPVDDLGAALFALLYHWLWRDCADPEAALTRARSAFLTGAWPAAAVEWAQPLLAAHLRDLLVEWIKIPSRQNVRKERLRKVLCNLYKDFGESPDVLDSWEIQLNAWRQRGAVNAASVAAETLATRILDRRAEFPFRYVGHFALGFGSTGHPPTAV